MPFDTFWLKRECAIILILYEMMPSMEWKDYLLPRWLITDLTFVCNVQHIISKTFLSHSFQSLHCGFHFSFIFRIRLNDLSSAQKTIYLCLQATTCNILDIFLKWNTITIYLLSLCKYTKRKNMWHWYIQRIKDNAFACTFSFL